MKTKVKICGVTLSEQARAIVALGADYIGCIIEFPQSSRSVTRERAREIREVVEGIQDPPVPPLSKRGKGRLVGVVVDVPIEELKRLIDETGIRIWQLYVNEDVEYVTKVKEIGVEVWRGTRGKAESHPERKFAGSRNKRQKEIFFWMLNQVQHDKREDLIDKIVVDARHPVHGAGGSGQLSDWKYARELVQAGYSVVLSGGLNPENVQNAIKEVMPDVVDVASGVETSSGVKDLFKVEQFIRLAKNL